MRSNVEGFVVRVSVKEDCTLLNTAKVTYGTNERVARTLPKQPSKDYAQAGVFRHDDKARA